MASSPTVSKKHRQMLIGIILALVLIWFSARNLDFRTMWQQLKNAHYWWILPTLLVRGITFYARGWRWALLLAHRKKIRPSVLFSTIIIGYMANNLLPFRLGEVVRTYALRRQENIPISTGLVTVGVERIFDGVIVLLFVFIGLLFTPLPTQFRPFIIMGTIVFSGALLTLIALARNPQLTMRWLKRLIPQRLQTIIFPIIDKFQDGLGSLRNWRQLLMLVGSSLLVWFLETGKFWFMAQAFDIHVPYSYLILMIGIVNLVSALPGLPGFVGTFDAPVVGMLTLYGIGQDVAWAYTLVLHLTLWLSSITVGGFFALKMGLSWSEISGIQQNE